MDEKYFGGNYGENEDMSEINFSLDSCNWDPEKNETNLNNETLKCSNDTEIKNFFLSQSGQVYMNVIFPKTIVDSENLEKPIFVSTHSHIKLLDYILVSEEYIYLEYEEFYDDQGWIVKSETMQPFLSYLKSRDNGKYIDKTEYTRNKMNSIYTLLVNMNRVYPIMKRSFMKLQNLTAICGRFISFLRLIMTIICYFINAEQKKKIYVENLFRKSKGFENTKVEKNEYPIGVGKKFKDGFVKDDLKLEKQQDIDFKVKRDKRYNFIRENFFKENLGIGKSYHSNNNIPDDSNNKVGKKK